MKQPRISRYNIAFTLIELLVVVGIIAILAAIIFPVFAQAKISAKHTVCLSNMRQIGMAFIMYAGNNDDGYPPLFGMPDTIIPSGSNYRKPILGYDNSVSPHTPARRPINPGNLDDFIKSRQIYKCPFQPEKYPLIWGFNSWLIRTNTGYRNSLYYNTNPLASRKEFGPLGSRSIFVTRILGEIYDPVNGSRDEMPDKMLFFWHHSADTLECSTVQMTNFYDSLPRDAQDHLTYFEEDPQRGRKIHRGDGRVILMTTSGSVNTRHASQISRPWFSMQKTGMGYPDY